jgi:hypothetical protein
LFVTLCLTLALGAGVAHAAESTARPTTVPTTTPPRDAAASDDHLATLRLLVESSGLKVRTVDHKSWVIAYTGDNLETIVVYISLFEHFALVQSEVADAKPTMDQAIQILKMNYVLDLARIAIDDTGVVTALQQGEVALLSATALRRMVEDVAQAADDCARFFKNGATTARLR